MQNTSATPATPATAVYRSARPKDLDACLRLWDAHHHLFFMVYETTKLLKKYGLYFFFICVAKKLSNLQQQQQDQQHAETESQSYFFPDPDVLLDRGFQALASALVSWLQRQIVVQQVAPPTLDQVQECTATAVCRILLRTMFDFVAAIAFLHYLHLFVVTLVYRFSVRPALVRSVEASSRKNVFPDRVVVCELWPEEEAQQAQSETPLPSKEKPAVLVGVLRARNPAPSDGSGRAPTTWSLWDCVVAPHLRGTHQVGPGLVRAMAREARNENESRRSAAVSEFRNSRGFTPRTSRVPPMVTKFTCTVLSPPAKTMCRRLGFQFVGSAIHARNSAILQMLFEKLPFFPWEMGMSVEDAMYAGGAQVVAAESDPDGRGSPRGVVRGPAQAGGTGNFLEQALQDVSARRRQVHLLEHGGVEDAGHVIADAPRRGVELVEQNAIASPSSRTLGGC